jgi:hypothetical protein
MKKEAPTFEQLTEKLDKLAESQAETDRQMKETDRRMQETDRQIKETDRQMRETDCYLKEKFALRSKEIDKLLGSWSNNQGAFAEEYFFNSFENGRQCFFGEKFDEIEKNVKGIEKGWRDEYDIVLINGKSIGIIEVKFKAHQNDIPDILHKAVTFRSNFPSFAGHRIYLGLATLAFYPELEKDCIDKGIAVIKQVGDTVVINDGHLKVF